MGAACLSGVAASGIGVGFDAYGWGLRSAKELKYFRSMHSYRSELSVGRTSFAGGFSTGTVVRLLMDTDKHTLSYQVLPPGGGAPLGAGAGSDGWFVGFKGVEARDDAPLYPAVSLSYKGDKVHVSGMQNTSDASAAIAAAAAKAAAAPVPGPR